MPWRFLSQKIALTRYNSYDSMIDIKTILTAQKMAVPEPGEPMFESQTSPVEDDRSTAPLRVVAIIAKNQILEVWHIHHMRTDYRERDMELPKEVRTRLVNGRRQRYQVYRRQRALQEWGRFVIRRYQATRMVPWMPSIGLTMLVPGTLLAAGSANQGIMRVPLGILIVQFILISLGGLLAVASGWRILRRMSPSGGVPVESLGVSGHALGFPSGVIASEILPSGFRAGRFKGQIEVEAAIGQWNVVEEHEADGGWSQST